MFALKFVFFYFIIKKIYFVKVLLRLIKPYIRIKLSYLADELKIEKDEVVRLLVEIIHDKCPELKIDQVNETVIRIGYNQELLEQSRAKAMNKVCEELETLLMNLVDKCA